MHNPHLSDPAVFADIIAIQQLREDNGDPKQQSAAIEARLAEARVRLFPEAMDSLRLQQLAENGRAIVPGGVPKRGFFDTNPPNWLMPSWSRRVEARRLQEQDAEIRAVLRRLRGHASRETVREMDSSLTEGRIRLPAGAGGKERR